MPNLDSGSQVRFSRKTIRSVVAIILAFISIPLGVYLVRQKQIFETKAFEKIFQVDRRLTGNVNLISSWKQIFPERFLNGQKIVLANNYIVSLGGIDKTSRTTLVSTAKINKEGSLDRFMPGSAVPAELSDFAVASLGSHIFVLGGRNDLQEQTAVYINKIDSNGLLDKWKVSAPLPKALSYLSVAVSGKYVYAIGGKSKGADQNTVYSAKINPDGTLGNWKVASTLPKALSSLAAAVDSNYLIIGGGKSDNLDQAEVYAAEINPDGTLGSWSKISSFPKALSKQSFLTSSGYLLAVGGKNQGKPQQQIYFTSLHIGSEKCQDNKDKICPRIGLSSWSLANSLPVGFISSSAASFNNLVLVVGQAGTGNGNGTQLLIGKAEPASFVYPRTAITGQTQEVKVLDLRYYPLDPESPPEDPWLDKKETGLDYSLSYIRGQTDALQTSTAQNMNIATKYHGYKTEASPYLSFSVIDSKEYLEAMPLSNYHARDKEGIYRPDYRKILTEKVNICDLVDNQGVGEVWIWGYHYDDLEPNESNMSMGQTSKAFWDYNDYGDISNSEQINDLPICNKTYTLYNYNYAAGEGYALEDHTHQLESLFNYFGNSLPESFYHPTGFQSGINRCGWTHYPPNMPDSGPGYIWNSENIVKSDCKDWKADGFGETEDISCHSWYGDTCLDDGGTGFKVWWMQSIPGLGNNLTYQGYKMRNWWEFYGNLDEALKNGRFLYVVSPASKLSDWETLTPIPQPKLDPSAVVSPEGYIFVTGGIDDQFYISGDVYTAKINDAGKIDNWFINTSLISKVYYHTSFIYNNYLFVLGGKNQAFASSDIFSAQIQPDGILSNWNKTTSLPLALNSHGSIVYKNHVFVMGGYGEDHTLQKKVYSAEIFPDGTLSSWTETTKLPNPLAGAGVALIGNYLYIIGGIMDGGYSSQAVYSTTVNENGTLGEWLTMYPLPKATAYLNGATDSNFIFAVGGANYDGSVYSAEVIKSNDSILPWTEDRSLPSKITDTSAIVYKDRLYVIGGYLSSHTQNTVYSAKIQQPKACLDVITYARNTQTKECKQFPNSCLPIGWVQDPSCN